MIILETVVTMASPVRLHHASDHLLSLCYGLSGAVVRTGSRRADRTGIRLRLRLYNPIITLIYQGAGGHRYPAHLCPLVSDHYLDCAAFYSLLALS